MSDDRHKLAQELRNLAEHPPEPAELAARLVALADDFESDDLGAIENNFLAPYSFLVNTAKDSMTFLARDYTYVAVNQAFLNLIPPDMGNPLGKCVADVWGQQSFERSIRPALDRCFSGIKVTYELWLHPPGRMRGYFQVNCTPYHDKSGAVTHVAVLTRDLTEWRHATDAAHKSENLYRSLVENINEAIFTLTREGFISYISPNVERITGFKPQHYLGTNFLDHVHQEDKDSTLGTYEKVLEGGESGAEFRSIMADGSYMWAQISSSLVMENKQVVGVTGTLRDITESREARLALTRSERKYRDIFHNIQDAYFEADLDGMVIEVSPSAQRINGVSREELLGKNVESFFNSPSTYNRIKEQLLAYRRVSDVEVELAISDGQPVHGLLSAALVHDQERGGFKMVGSVHDITALKLAEAELQQAMAILESLVDTVPDPIYVKNEDHSWRMVNKAFAELLGLPKGQLYGKSASDFFPSDQATDFQTMDQQAFDQGGRVTHEEEFWDTGGVWHVISTNKAVFEPPDGAGRLLVGALRDVTEQKRLEEMLWRAKEEAESLAVAKSNFLANMSHEIRTPLNGVIGMLQLMLTGKLDSRQTEYASTAMSSARGLLTVINDVLDLSKIEAGKMEIVKIRFDLREMVKSVIQALSRAVCGNDVTISFEVADDVPPFLFGGGTRIRQVLFNLVGNALKFTHEGSVHIDVSWLPQDGKGNHRLLVCVEDTGVGIPDESVEHIFDDFTQADDSHTREYQGAGLGLSIVRRLVELMDGAVTIMSELGKGTTICFTAQAEGVAEEVKVEASPCHDENSALPYKLALVVEDNSVNQVLACRFLEKFGVEAVGASNGREALDELEKRAGTENAYDLVLMDIQMPVMDGLEATKQIRASKIPGLAQLPIVALTAHAMEGDRERFLASGMDGYTAKPLVMEDFRKVLAVLPRSTE